MLRRMTTLLAVLLAVWALALAPELDEGRAQDRNGEAADVVCGAEWMTFHLPGISEAERQAFSTAVANHAWNTVLTIHKADVRNYEGLIHKGLRLPPNRCQRLSRVG